jgi:hypothetical protein
MVMAFSLSKIGFRSAAILGERKAKCQALSYSTVHPSSLVFRFFLALVARTPFPVTWDLFLALMLEIWVVGSLNSLIVTIGVKIQTDPLPKFS